MTHTGGPRAMGVNQSKFQFYREQNKKFNVSNYTRTFPLTQPFTKDGAVPSDPNYINANADYSGGVQTYSYTAHPTQDSYLIKFGLTVVTSTAMDPTDYGDLPALTNGMYYELYQDGEVKATTIPFTNNIDIQRFVDGNVNVISYRKIGISFTAIAELFVPFVLRAGTDDRVTVYLNDDFSGLVSHTFTTRGYYLDPSNEES